MSVCGEEHPPGPVGRLGTMFGGIEFKVCPGIPDGFVYEDRDFDSGPPGVLHRIVADE